MRRHLLASAFAAAILVTGVWAEAAPKVIETSPAAGDQNVDPETNQIVVTFDQPVKMNSWSVVYAHGGEFPELAGDTPITFHDNKTCVIAVTLKPKTTYAVGFNSATRQGFKSADEGTPAEPYTLTFTTGDPQKPALDEGPHVIKSVPADGTRGLEPGTLDLVITFSEPMRPGQASIMTPPAGPHLKIIGSPRWKDPRTFVVPIMLAPETTYQVGINTGQEKRFVSAGDGTAATPMEFTFSTASPMTTQPTTQPGDGSKPMRLRYNYQVGDAGRLIQFSVVELKLKLNDEHTIPLGQKAGINCIEEVLATQDGKPVTVKKMISEYMLIADDPESGEKITAPQLEAGTIVKIDRRSGEANIELLEGNPPAELMALLAEDEFLDLLPRQPIVVGKSYSPPVQTLNAIKSEFDPSGTGQIDFKLTCTRVAPIKVEDARNEMFRNQGGGEPITYVFNVAEFDVDWKQTGKIENDIPFTMNVAGKVIFAMEAGIYLKMEAKGTIDIKPMPFQDEEGEMVTITGGGRYEMEYTYEPIAWKRRATTADGTAIEPGVSGGSSEQAADTPLATPRNSIAHQFALLKAGEADALKLCFVEAAREAITPELVEKAREEAGNYTMEDLFAEAFPAEDNGRRTVRVKMKNGRTLTILVHRDGQWLAETIWFK